MFARSAPADLYYERDTVNPSVMRATEKSRKMHDEFEVRNIDKYYLHYINIISAHFEPA